MNQLAIECRQLAKTYATGAAAVTAVAGVDLAIEHGEIYALLGPNGAGKTTLLGMLTTLLLPSSGMALVAGYDIVTQPAEVRRRIGVTFQEIVLDQDLTGRQVLDFHGRLYGLSAQERRQRSQELAELVELTDALDRKASTYSGGMKRRLELGRGLMTAPSIVVLDEPTQGLDPQNRASIWSYIRRLRTEKRTTILLTTHSMEEAEALADRVGIIDHGLLVAEGAPGELVRKMGADVIVVNGSGDGEALLRRLRDLPFVQQITHHPHPEDASLHRFQIGVDHGDLRLAQIIGLASEVGVQVREVSVARPTLADVFLAHTGHELRDR